MSSEEEAIRKWRQQGDLRWFEYRLRAIVEDTRRKQQMWRNWFVFSTCLLAIALSFIYHDYRYYHSGNIIELIFNHVYSTIIVVIWLISWFVFRMGDRIRAQSILVERVCRVLANYGLLCDDAGNLGICFNPEPVQPGVQEELCTVCHKFLDYDGNLCGGCLWLPGDEPYSDPTL